MTTVTYLLGAGASVGTKKHPGIPALDKLNADIKLMADRLSDGVIDKKFEELGKSDTVRKHLVSDIYTILDECENHQSIDTYARKLHLRGEAQELRKVKRILAAYFIWAQQKAFDLRYDSFCATLIENKDGNLKLPGNLKILSWNYDYQFEKAFFRYSYGKMNNHQFLKALQLLPYPSDYFRDQTYLFDQNSFSLLHLNGVADLIQSGGTDFARNLEIIPEESKTDRLETALSYYWQLDSAHHVPEINYAWENDNEIIAKARQVMGITEVLVVIGYSFPPFNRKVDSIMINSAGKLKKIYIQSPPNTIEGVKNRLVSMMKRQLEPELISSVDQFHIPYEYV